MRRARLLFVFFAAMQASSRAFAGIAVSESRVEIDGRSISVLTARDDAFPGKRPGVLVFHPSLAGVKGYIEGRARKLAAMGYLVYAPTLAAPADLDGATKDDQLSVPQVKKYRALVDERAEAALAALRRDPLLEKDKIAVVAYCHLGGPGAMNLVRRGQDISGVALFFGGIDPQTLPPAWKTHKIKAKILALLGGMDQETLPYLAAFQQEMNASGADWRMVLYGKAQHGFTVPDAAEHGEGRAYDADADLRSWAELTTFLSELFKTGRP